MLNLTQSLLDVKQLNQIGFWVTRSVNFFGLPSYKKESFSYSLNSLLRDVILGEPPPSCPSSSLLFPPSFCFRGMLSFWKTEKKLIAIAPIALFYELSPFLLSFIILREQLGIYSIEVCRK